MVSRVPKALLDKLIESGHLKKADITALVARAEKEGRDIGAIVIEGEFITDDELTKLKSELYRLPVVELSEMEKSQEAFREISEDVAGFYRVIPFSIAEGVLKVALIDPEDINALEALKFIAADKGLKLDKYVVSYRDFAAALKRFKSLSGEVGKALESIAQNESQKLTQQDDDLRLEDITAESPVTKVVASMLNHAVDGRSSDIHIEPFDERTRVRFHIDGVLQSVLDLPKNLHNAVSTRIKILSNLKIDEVRVPQDGRFSIFQGKTKIDFRVSTFPTKAGEKLVMRILDPLSSRIDLNALGVTGRSAELLKEAIERPFGIILITGPTGSGKSTTIAGILKQINTEEINIVTLEDPVEYFIDGVNQSQTHEEIGYTFASGLRSILRQDPDVIMVGEIRDRETAALAVQAALTGHIVLSTLHTNDALGIVPRLVDMGIEKYLLPSTLNLAAAQRLLRRLCKNCKVETVPDTAEQKIIDDALAQIPPEIAKAYEGKNKLIFKPNPTPCKECGGKAYKGRVGIFEMLHMTPDLEKVILGNLSDTALRAEARNQGMITMFQDGVLKVLDGICSLEELLTVAQAEDNKEDEEDRKRLNLTGA